MKTYYINTNDLDKLDAQIIDERTLEDAERFKNYLNADDALTFTRMRYAAGGDYGRTDRQRRVLTALAESIRGADVWKLLSLVDQILPHISTNLDDAEILRCIKVGAAILAKGGEIQTLRIPQDEAHYQASIRDMSVLVPNLKKCREDLQEFIYGTEE